MLSYNVYLEEAKVPKPKKRKKKELHHMTKKKRAKEHLAWSFDKHIEFHDLKSQLNEETFGTHLKPTPAKDEHFEDHPIDAKHYAEQHKAFGPNIQAHISSYKEWSGHANEPLRRHKGKIEGKMTDDAQEHIDALDTATSKPTPEDHHVYRGFGDDFDISKMKVGTKFTDHGFTSTSASHDVVCSGFAHHKTVEKKDGSRHLHRIVARIKVPKGTKAHFLDASDRHENNAEQEMLIHRGTTYKVVGHSSRSYKPGEYEPRENESYQLGDDELDSHIHDHIVHMEVHSQRAPVKAKKSTK